MSEELKEIKLTDEEIRVDGRIYFCPDCMEWNQGHIYCPRCGKKNIQRIFDAAGFPECEGVGCKERVYSLDPEKRFCKLCGAKNNLKRLRPEIEEARKKFKHILETLTKNAALRDEKIAAGEIVEIDNPKDRDEDTGPYCPRCKKVQFQGSCCITCGRLLKDPLQGVKIPVCNHNYGSGIFSSSYASPIRCDDDKFCWLCGREIPESTRQAVRDLSKKIKALKAKSARTNQGIKRR